MSREHLLFRRVLKLATPPQISKTDSEMIISLLDVLDTFEDTILEGISKPGAPFNRPWMESEQPLPLKESLVEHVEFPEADESSGEILVHFFGPELADNLLCKRSPCIHYTSQ